jgi:integrase
MRKPRLKAVASTTVNRTVTPLRRPNAELRTRECLTHSEVEALIKAARNNRPWSPGRDHDARGHGLRAAELVDLRWSQVDLDNAMTDVWSSRCLSSHPSLCR